MELYLVATNVIFGILNLIFAKFSYDLDKYKRAMYFMFISGFCFSTALFIAIK